MDVTVVVIAVAGGGVIVGLSGVVFVVAFDFESVKCQRWDTCTFARPPLHVPLPCAAACVCWQK